MIQRKSLFRLVGLFAGYFAAAFLSASVFTPPAQAETLKPPPGQFCWKNSYSRGVGTPPDKCPDGLHKEGALCYEDCDEDYADYRTPGVAWGSCLQKCTGGLTDQGLFCRAAEYHVTEYPWQFGDPLDDTGMRDRCLQAQEAKLEKDRYGCEKRGLVVVEKCPPGWTHVLGFCRPPVPKCTGEGGLGYAGQFDLSCTKDTKFKEPHITVCGTDKDRNKLTADGGLCYPECADGTEGIGPLCWTECSDIENPDDKSKTWVKCGAGCAITPEACQQQTTDLVRSVVESALDIAGLVATFGTSGAAKPAREAISAVRSAGYALQHGSHELLTSVGPAALDLALSVRDAANRGVTEEEKAVLVAEEVLNVSSLMDPTGIMGVSAAYTKPLCPLPSHQTPEKWTVVPGLTGYLVEDLEKYRKGQLVIRPALATMRIKKLKNQELQIREEARKILSSEAEPYIKEEQSLKGMLDAMKAERSQVAQASERDKLDKQIEEIDKRYRNVVGKRTLIQKGLYLRKPEPRRGCLGCFQRWSNVLRPNVQKRLRDLEAEENKVKVELKQAEEELAAVNELTALKEERKKLAAVDAGFFELESLAKSTRTLTLFNGTAKDMAVDSAGKLWIISTEKYNNDYPNDYRIRWADPNDATGPGKLEWNTVPGAAKRIAAGARAWVVNDSGAIYRWLGNKWERIRGPKVSGREVRAFDIGVSRTGDSGAERIGNVSSFTGGEGGTSDVFPPPNGVYILAEPKVGSNYSIYKWTRVGSGMGWKKFPGAGTRIDVDALGNPWVIKDKEIWGFVKNRWKKFPFFRRVAGNHDYPFVAWNLSVQAIGPFVVGNTNFHGAGTNHPAMLRLDPLGKWRSMGIEGEYAVVRRGDQLWTISGDRKIYGATQFVKK